jgi:hypothetical protein
MIMIEYFSKWVELVIVTTLALGLRPRQGLARLQAKRKSPGVKENVRE